MCGGVEADTITPAQTAIAMTELFPESSMLQESPKLRFLREHDLVTRKLPGGTWRCELGEDFGSGDTEDDAVIDFCLKTKLKHWNQV